MSAVVFVHGWGVGSGIFDELRALLGERRATLAPALPGYGTPMCEPYAAHRLAEVLSRAAPAPCSIVGWSLGALVALAWALARPRDVDRLVLIAATPCFVQRRDWAHAMPAVELDAFARALEESCESALGRFAALQALDDASAKRVARRLREHAAPCAVQDRAALEAGLSVLRQTDLRERIAEIRQRVLLVHGDRDRIVPVGAAVYLAEHLPRARLERIDDAAHAPFVSHAPRIARAIAEFLDER